MPVHRHHVRHSMHRSLRFLPALALVVAGTRTGYAATAPSAEDWPAVPFAQPVAYEAGATALPEGGALRSGDGSEPAIPPANAPASAPIVESRPASSGNPYYGPGWSGPVNDAPPAVCPAWYSPHTACVPAGT